MAKQANISRRGFLQASAASAVVATSAFGLSGCAPAAAPQSAATAVPAAAAAAAPAAAPALAGKLKVAWVAQQQAAQSDQRALKGFQDWMAKQKVDWDVTVTDAKGYYKFITVKPGAYPWGNHHNAWRPNHIHFSVFGHSFLSRLVTQMYFPGDYLFPYDPIFNSVLDEKARARMISTFDLENTVPDWALAFRFDIVLRGREATPLDNDEH